MAANNPEQEIDHDNLCATYSGSRSLLIRKEQKMYRQESSDMKERNKVVLHLGFHDDAIVITRNTHDNETDSDREDVSTNVVQKSVTDNQSFNQKMASFNHKTCDAGLASDIQNGTVVITRNTHDNDTDSARDVSTNIVKKCTADNPSYNQTTASFNRKTYTTRLSSDLTRPKHTVLPACRCKRKCFRKFSKSTTKAVYESFWRQGDSVERKKWIMKHVEKSDVKQRSRKKKQETRNYFLTEGGGRRMKVCSGYFQRVLGLTNGSWLEPLIGNNHQHHQVAGRVQDVALITPHQKDSQSFNLFPGNMDRDVNDDDGFCNRDQNQDGSQDGSARDINISNFSHVNISSFSNKGRNVDASQYIHIDDSSDCEKSVTKDRIMKLRNNEDSINRTYKKDITKDSITERINDKDAKIMGCGEGIRKDSVAKHINIASCRGKHDNVDNTNTGVDIYFCCNQDLNKDLTETDITGNVVHLASCKGRGEHRNCTCSDAHTAGYSNRNERNIRNTERKVQGVHICSAAGRGNMGLNSIDPEDKSRRRSVGKDGIDNDADDDGSRNSGRIKDSSSGDISIADTRTRGRATCSNKDRTVRSRNMCCVRSKNTDNGTHRDITINGFRNMCCVRSKNIDSTHRDITINGFRNMCCVRSKNIDNSTHRDITYNGFRNRRQKKDTIRDGAISDGHDSSSGNKNELKDRLMWDINIDGRSNKCCGAVSDDHISSSGNKNELKDRLMWDINIDGRSNKCRGAVSDDHISSSGNKNELKDRLMWDINIDGRSNKCCGAGMNKENSNVRKYIEQHYGQLDKTNPSTRSIERAVEKLHLEYLSSYPASRLSYDKFRNIYDHVDNDGLTCIEAVNEGREGILSPVSESARVTRRSRSVVGAGGAHESEMPERRRRSTRITRMQGSMAEEDSLLQIGVEAGDGVASGSGREDLPASEKNGLGGSKVKLKLRSKPRLPAKQNWDQSEKLARSQFVVGCQLNDSFHSDKQEMNLQPSQLKQSALRSRRFPRNKDGGGSSRNSNTSGHMTKKKVKKKTVKESNNVKLRNDTRWYNERKQNSKKLCKMSTLKKRHKHPMLPPCNCSRRRCIENIPEERRRNIHDQFWNLSSYKDRKRWLVKYVEKRERKNKVLSLFPQRKNESKRYFLPDDKNEVVEVCRLFFIHTLGFKWDSVVDAVVRTKLTPGDAGKRSSHQLKKLPRQLPDYIVDAVTEYLTSVRNSCHATGEAHADDGRKLCDEGQIDDGIHEIACRDEQTKHVPGLKVKDLFKNWKIEYKSLKFNLGYHSFRRIFQNVIDPVPNCQEEVTTNNLHIHTSDVFPVTCADVEHSWPSGLSNTCPDITDHQDATTADFSEEESDESKSSTNLKVPSHTESTKDSDLAKHEPETLAVDGKSVCQDDKCIDLKNCSRLHENLANDDENCILDVGSGYFKPIDGAAIKSLYPYTNETKYKKRRSLSMRNDRSNYPVLPPCKCRKRKCAEKFTESQRQDINTMFWDLGSYNERKQWILEHIKRADIKRRIVFSEGTPRKLESRWYYLPDSDGNKVDVCKGFFLRTLGYRWDSVIDTIGKTTPKGVKWAVPDRRGRKPPPHKISDEAVASMAVYIENVCNTYQPFCHKRSQENVKECKSTTSGQIPYGLTMKQLFEDYKSKHPNHKFGYESFRKVFRRVHGEFVASLPPDVESSEEPETVYSKMTVLDDKDYPANEDSSVRKNYLVGKDCLVTNDYAVGKDFSERKDYPVDKESTVEDYSIDKDYSEATIEGCSSSFRPEASQFAPTTVSYSETNLHTLAQPPPAAPQSPYSLPDTHHEAARRHQAGSHALEHTTCLYQSHNHSSDSQQCLPVIQVPDTVEPVASDHYSSADNGPSMMYNHNLYCPPTSVPGHFVHTVDQLGHGSGVNPHTGIDSATYGAQGQFPTYFVSNPEPLRHQVYQMASQCQSILHHIAESNRFFSYDYPSADNTFHEGSEKHHLFMKQDFHRSNMNCHNIPKTSYSYVAEPAAIQSQYPSQTHSMHHNTQQESTTTILSPYSDENDNSFAQDHQEASSATKGQDAAFTSFNNGCPSRIEAKESASKIKTQTKNSKSDKKKVNKEIKMKPKSVRNYGNHYPMLAPCNCKKKKCTDKFSEKARQKLHDMFWELKDYNDRKQWMLLHIKRGDCKRRRIDQFESFRKLESRWYFFPDESGNQHEVCKDFFLRTLGYKWDSVIDTIRRTTPKGDTTTRPDQRGRKAPAHKLPSAVLRSVVQYIESMQQVSQPFNEHVKNVEDSNCERSHENTTGRSGGQIAVPYGLTMKDLYDDYKAKHVGHKIGYESFRRIFRALSKSEKIVFDEKASEDEFLSVNSQDLVDL